MLLAATAFAQVEYQEVPVRLTYQIPQVDPTMIDPNAVNLEDANFYFQGPMEIYVDGLEYGGVEYSALLLYDGEGNLAVARPPSGARLRPQGLDFSNVEISLTSDGRIRVANMIGDGYVWTGSLRYAPTATRHMTLAEMPKVVGPVVSPGERQALAKVDRLEGQVDNLRVAINRSQNQVNDLERQLRQRQDQLQQREETIQQLRGGNRAMADLQDRLESRDDRISELERDLDDAEERIAELESRVSTAAVTRLVRLPSLVQRGFRGGDAALGSWSGTSTLRQRDGDQYYAKYVIPARQSGNEYTYTFSGKSNEAGWVGLGLHMLAANAGTANGYGFGRSYLVWLTRDPKNQTDNTYVQLYQSFDDVRMIQIASAAIPFDVADGVEVAVHVNRQQRQMRVFVDGNYAFTYPMEGRIMSGTSVALRALGSVQFDELEIRGR